MNDKEFRAFLDLLMCCDPWPDGVSELVIKDYMDSEAQKRDFSDWIHAYHYFEDY
jgi:hypothetical protein